MNIPKNKKIYTYIFLLCRIILLVTHFTISLHCKNKLDSLIRLKPNEYNDLNLSLSSITTNSDTSIVNNLTIKLENPKIGGKISKPHGSFTLLSLYTTHFLNRKSALSIHTFSIVAFVLMLLRIMIITFQIFGPKTHEHLKKKIDEVSNVTVTIGLNVLALGQGIFGIFFTNQLCGFEQDQPHLFTNGDAKSIFPHFGGCSIYTTIIVSSILCWACSIPDAYVCIANISKKFRSTSFCSGFSIIFLGILCLDIAKYCSAGAELNNQLSIQSKSLYPKYDMSEYLSHTLSLSLAQTGLSSVNGKSEVDALLSKNPNASELHNLHLKVEINNQVENISFALASISLVAGIITIITASAGSSLSYFKSKTLAVFNFCSSFLMVLFHTFTLLSADYTYTGASFYCSYNKYFPRSYVFSYEQNTLFKWACTLKPATLVFMAIIGSLFILNAADLVILFILLFKSK